MGRVPELETSSAGNRLSGSWVIVDRETGLPVLETYERRTAEAINQSRYEVLTAYQWLVRFNRQMPGCCTDSERGYDDPDWG
jgi:hypothetical protein